MDKGMKSLGVVLLTLCTGLATISCRQQAVEEEVWIENGDRKIYGVLNRPDGGRKQRPLLIISHGFNGSHEFGRNYFDCLGEMGYLCYAFDFGCGSLGSKTDNNTMEMSILDECEDLKAVIRHFRSCPDVDPDRIVLLGESQGGLVSALVADEMPDAVSSLILVFPALCIPDNWNRIYPSVEDIPDTTRLWDVPIGRRFFTEIRDMDVFRHTDRFDNPVLIVQGDKDPVVSLEDSRRAVELYDDARLHVIAGAGHGFSPNEFEESLKQIRSFLK